MSSPWRNEHEQDGSWPGIPSIQDLYPDKFDCDDEPQQGPSSFYTLLSLYLSFVCPFFLTHGQLTPMSNSIIATCSPLHRPSRSVSLPTRSFHLATILEDFEQCDFPALNLGTESLACTPNAATAWTLGGLRRARSRTISTQAQRRQAASADRDCAIWYVPNNLLLLAFH